MKEVHLQRLAITIAALMLTAAAPQRTSGPAAAIRLNNLGVAYMNQARITEALQTFRRAEAQDPSLFAARLNEGIALLNSPAAGRSARRSPRCNAAVSRRARGPGTTLASSIERWRKPMRLSKPSSRLPGSIRATRTRCTFSGSFMRRPGVTIRPSRLSKNALRSILSISRLNSVWRAPTSFPEMTPRRRNTLPGSTN